MDDLYATLAIVKYNMAYRDRDQETLSGRKPQSLLWKFVYGWLIFSLLLLLLLGPVIYFSPLNPATEPNEVLQASMTVSLSAQRMSTQATARNSKPKVTYTLYQSSNHTNITACGNLSCAKKNADSYKLGQAQETGNSSNIFIRDWSLILLDRVLTLMLVFVLLECHTSGRETNMDKS